MRGVNGKPPIALTGSRVAVPISAGILGLYSKFVCPLPNVGAQPSQHLNVKCEILAPLTSNGKVPTKFNTARISPTNPALNPYPQFSNGLRACSVDVSGVVHIPKVKYIMKYLASLAV